MHVRSGPVGIHIIRIPICSFLSLLHCCIHLSCPLVRFLSDYCTCATNKPARARHLRPQARSMASPLRPPTPSGKRNELSLQSSPSTSVTFSEQRELLPMVSKFKTQLPCAPRIGEGEEDSESELTRVAKHPDSLASRSAGLLCRPSPSTTRVILVALSSLTRRSFANF